MFWKGKCRRSGIDLVANPKLQLPASWGGPVFRNEFRICCRKHSWGSSWASQKWVWAITFEKVCTHEECSCSCYRVVLLLWKTCCWSCDGCWRWCRHHRLWWMVLFVLVPGPWWYLLDCQAWDLGKVLWSSQTTQNPLNENPLNLDPLIKGKTL